MPTVSYEGGIRPTRIEYVAESSFGTPPTDPAWNPFSDTVTLFEPTIMTNAQDQRGLGDADPKNFHYGTGEYGATVTYDLQQKTSSGNTFLDGSSNPNDAVTDGIQRDSDNRLQNSHTVVSRIDQSDLDAANTVNGSTSKDTRQYFVGVGGLVSPTLNGSPDGPQVEATVEYTFEYAEHHQLDQPGSDTTIDVKSTNANDSGTVTLEDEDAGTTEDVTITANGTATSTSSFSDLDAVYLDSEQPGDITIAENGGDDLMVISGQNSRDNNTGDRGIPPLGAGSHASAIGQNYEIVQAGSYERPSSTDFAMELTLVEIAVENAIDEESSAIDAKPVISENERTTTADTDVFGETEYHQQITDALNSTENNFIWSFSGGSIQLDNAQVMEVTKTHEASQGRAGVSVSLEGQGVTVS